MKLKFTLKVSARISGRNPFTKSEATAVRKSINKKIVSFKMLLLGVKKI